MRTYLNKISPTRSRSHTLPHASPTHSNTEMNTTSGGPSENTASARPKRATYPSARLRDADNAATPELTCHRPSTNAGASVPHSPTLSDDEHDSLVPSSPPPCTSVGHKRKRANTAQVTESDEDSIRLSSALGKGAVHCTILFLLYIDRAFQANKWLLAVAHHQLVLKILRSTMVGVKKSHPFHLSHGFRCDWT